ncbi:ABC transporter permease [uncultured Rossellomorea sp.]|uniref:ABC transporter permease n=1 Tax=uncultured Rossellomorea sp. TaxID=2837549 RepID=UPI002622E3BA|nr:ABC transporter permease [uncultured Rossellomorea sp.]
MVSDMLQRTYINMQRRTIYRYLILILGLPVNLVVFFFYLYRKRKDPFLTQLNQTKAELYEEGLKDKRQRSFVEELLQKKEFFNQHTPLPRIQKKAERLAEVYLEQTAVERTEKQLALQGLQKVTYDETFQSLISSPYFLILSFLPGSPMYLLLFLYSNHYIKYIFERLVMSMFVIIGVAFLVFTILYISPFNPAANILGETATKDQIAAFNHIYGLDQPYLVQLWNTIKGIATFDLGSSFTGNEEVSSSIARKFPITLTLAVISLLMAIAIAIPIGIISATKTRSFFDYTFMFLALIGLSIPNFWQGLIFILNFSIKWKWLPATYSPNNWLSIIMPAVVLGTALTAAIARMMRSSTLEVINEDYITTARSKGLNERQVLWKHAVKNAMIPVITVIGLLFGGMLGGAAVTEKVFNISGLGSYIVDKQFIPDIPSIMGGVVYIAITISLVNLLIDILYAFFDPRIRSKMKHY